MSDFEELYQAALSVIRQEQKASTSLIQRRLQIGYVNAANLMAAIQEDGHVSAPNAIGKREVYIK